MYLPRSQMFSRGCPCICVRSLWCQVEAVYHTPKLASTRSSRAPQPNSDPVVAAATGATAATAAPGDAMEAAAEALALALDAVFEAAASAPLAVEAEEGPVRASIAAAAPADETVPEAQVAPATDAPNGAAAAAT